MGWYEFEQHSRAPAPQLVEAEQKPFLYDHKGRPLVRDKRVGFRPPEATPRQNRRRVQRKG